MAARAYSLAHEGEHYQYLSTLDQCLSRGVPGSMLPAGYNNTHRIVQTPDHVVLQHEMIHDLRIIPLSDHAHIDDRIGLWMGDARAHWDGEVLVVETQNFNNRGWIATSGAGRRLKGIPTSTRLHVVERYERVSETTIMWTVTVDDPNVYTRPWTISMASARHRADPPARHGRTRVRDLRVRLPRGKLRHPEHPRRRADGRDARRTSHHARVAVACSRDSAALYLRSEASAPVSESEGSVGGSSRTMSHSPAITPRHSFRSRWTCRCSASASFEYRPCFVAARRMRSILLASSNRYSGRHVCNTVRWTSLDTDTGFLFGSSLHIGGPSRNHKEDSHS